MQTVDIAGTVAAGAAGAAGAAAADPPTHQPAAAAAVGPQDPPEDDSEPEEEGGGEGGGGGKKKKKKKKRKAKPKATPLTDTVSVTKAPFVGRFLKAREPLSQGQLLLSERPFASVALDGQELSVCSRCWAPSRIHCEACRKVSFCSDDCREAQAAVHVLECDALSLLPELCEPALLRLLARILCERVAGVGVTAAGEGQDAAEIIPTFEQVEDLVHHLDSFSEDWKASVSAGIEALLGLLPAEVRLPLSRVIALAGKINANAHGLAPRVDGVVVAVGLFPNTSLSNHSCAPNAIFCPSVPSVSAAGGPMAGTMQLRAVRDIAAGEEVAVRYVDLYQTREARRAQLLAEKGFECACVRCSAEMPDAVVGGFTCAVCGPEALLALPEGLCPSCGGRGDVARCLARTEEALLRATAQEEARDFAAAKETLQLVLPPPTAAGLQRSRGLLPPAPPGAAQERRVRVDLHPRHALKFRAAVDLHRVCMRLGDPSTAAAYAREACEACEAFFEGSLLLEVARCWEMLAEALRAVLAGASARLPAKRRAQLEAERRQAEARVLQVSRVCYGEGYEYRLLAPL